MNPQRRDFDGPEAQAEGLALAVARDLRAALTAQGRASLAVPGGTTPAPFLAALSGQTLDWSQVTVTLTDERCVPSSASRSNQRLVQANLLQGPAAAAAFLPLYRDLPTAAAAAAAAALDLAPLLPLDVCVLGLGEDLHSASLFPGAQGLPDALAATAPPVVALRTPEGAEARISLTLPVLQAARHPYLLIKGAAKLAAWERVLEAGPLEQAPLRGLLDRPGAALTLYYTA
ncbi:MAG: 6-phosphogluconolactonase [Rhodospirillales bacterium]